MNILFICRGNVGRSQMAAAICKKMFPQHTVTSAGTKVVNKEGERTFSFVYFSAF